MKRIKLTEGQLCTLIKGVINEAVDKEAMAMARSLKGKKVHTPWAGKQKITRVTKRLSSTFPYAEEDEEGTVFEFYGDMYFGPFMNLNASELYQLIQDGEMDDIILINDKETEDWLDEHDRYLAQFPRGPIQADKVGR